MIMNVIDNRRLRYRWKRVNAVSEPTWHDNKCPDADQAHPGLGEVDYEERNGVSVSEAIRWADELPYVVTLYLSDAA